jgi:multicomponent Na+:H+ antiporter subunit E
LIRVVGLGMMMFAFWMILSGPLTLDHSLLMRFAIGSCLLVVYIAKRMDFIDHEGVPLFLGGRFLGYFVWLTKEIFKCNLTVARIILSPSLPINPNMTVFRCSQNSDLGRVIFANSITLTPGTIVTGVENDQMQVHALTLSDTQDEEDEMDKRVTLVEGNA